MKILITGGCGFVGSELSIFLKKKKFDVISIDNLKRKGSKFNLKKIKSYGIKNFCFDIKNYQEFKKIPKIDLIIDCCAEVAVEASKKDLDTVINTNLIGTINILKKSLLDKCKIIYLSTSRVYSIKSIYKKVKTIKNLSIDENFSTESPISIYGLTKLTSEKLIKEFSYFMNVKYIINRFGVITGPGQLGKEDQGFVSLWMWNFINKKKLYYKGFNGKGNQVRDLIHINDVCKIIYKQIQKINIKNNLIFNIGGGLKNKISLRELSNLCQTITGNKVRIGKKPKTSSYDIPYYVSNNNFLINNYKIKLSKNIKDILFDLYNWQIKNYNELKKIYE